MTAALAAPLTQSERERLVSVVDAALTSFGLPAYSQVEADLALAHTGFNAAVRERAIGLANAENRRLRISLLVALQDVVAIQAMLTRGQHSEASLAVLDMLPELRAAAHKMRPDKLPLNVTVLDHAREWREVGR